MTRGAERGFPLATHDEVWRPVAAAEAGDGPQARDEQLVDGAEHGEKSDGEEPPLAMREASSREG